MEFSNSLYTPRNSVLVHSMNHNDGTILFYYNQGGAYWDRPTRNGLSNVCPNFLRIQNNNSDSVVRVSFAKNKNYYGDGKVPAFLQKNKIYYLKSSSGNLPYPYYYAKIYNTFLDAKNSTNQISFSESQKTQYFYLYFLDYVHNPIESRGSGCVFPHTQWYNEPLPATARLYMPESRLRFYKNTAYNSILDERKIHLGDLDVTLNFNPAKMIYSSGSLTFGNVTGDIVLYADVQKQILPQYFYPQFQGANLTGIKTNGYFYRYWDPFYQELYNNDGIRIYYQWDSNMELNYWFNSTYPRDFWYGNVPKYIPTYFSVNFFNIQSLVFNIFGWSPEYKNRYIKSFFIESKHPNCFIKTENSYI